MAKDKNKKKKRFILTAEQDTVHFKVGDVIATPLAFTYIAGRALTAVSRGAGAAFLWIGGRVVETAAPNFHKRSLDAIEKGYDRSSDWVNKKLNTPNVAFAVSVPLIAANVGIPLYATALLIAKPFTSMVTAAMVYKSATAAKMVKFLLPVTYLAWNRAEGSKGHDLINPVFTKTGEQLKRLDTYIEDIAPIYKRAKAVMKKAPLTKREEHFLKESRMPYALLKIPGMRRAGILSHHFGETAMELCGVHEPDTTFVVEVPKGLEGTIYFGEAYNASAGKGNIQEGFAPKTFAGRKVNLTAEPA